MFPSIDLPAMPSKWVRLGLPLAAGLSSLLVLLAWLAMTSPISAQVDNLLFKLGWQSFDAQFTSSVAWGDIDGDGDLDLAVGNVNAANQVFNNEAGVLAVNPVWELPDSLNTTSVAWGDMDGDGDLDLAVGNQPVCSGFFNPICEEGYNHVYLNEKGSLSQTASWQSADGAWTNSIAWGDVDGDGFLDLAVGNSDVNQVFKNSAGMLEETPMWESADSLSTQSVAWGDIDGDGDLDLAVGNENAANQVFKNDGGMLEETPFWESPENQAAWSVAWGDIDEDGDLDLAVGTRNAGNQLFQNVGGMLEETPFWESPDSLFTYSVAWGDMDGDGDLDLAVGNGGAANQIFQNVAGMLEMTPIWESTDAQESNSVAWGDINGDGDLDLAVGQGVISIFGPFGAANQMYENVGGVLQNAPSWESTDSGVSSAAWGDMDGDGDLDLAVDKRVFENVGGVLAGTPNWEGMDFQSANTVAWGDMEGDGDLDLAVGNFGAPIQIYRNEGGLLENNPFWESTDFQDIYSSVAWGDMDGDGDLDLAVGQGVFAPLIGPIGLDNQVYENVEGEFQQSWRSADAHYTTSVAWGDMDGDGDLDLAVGNEHAANQVYENVGGALAATPIWESAIPFTTQSVAWGDMDGDGDLDLAVGNANQANQIYQNVGGMLEAFPLWESPVSPGEVAWGDMDGDGDLDLASGNQVYENQDGILLNTPTWEAEDSPSTAAAWGDMDGDGDLDLAVGNQVYLNGSQGESTLPNNAPVLQLSMPLTGSAAFFSQGKIFDSSIIQIPYTLADLEGDLVGQVNVFYSLDGGGKWNPAVGSGNSNTTNLATGFFIKQNAPTMIISNTASTIGQLNFNQAGQVINDLEVALTIQHPEPNRLKAELVSSWPAPTGTTILLFDGVGGENTTLDSSLVFNDRAKTVISETAVISGIYKSAAPLSLLNGAPLTAPLSLVISDNATGEEGVVQQWSLRSTGAQHIFEWDTHASGVYGRSDNVVLRFVVKPHRFVDQPELTGTYRYTNGLVSLTPWPQIRATTLPFRLHGPHVQVINQAAVPLSQALVYSLPKDFIRGGQRLVDESRPHLASKTEIDGYFPGRPPIHLGDQLIALYPPPNNGGITFTDRISLYQTSATATPSGLNMHQVEENGLQKLTISEANNLLLLNLHLTLEWDARNDSLYLSKLENDLAQASQLLFDWTNGQVALGKITIYQNKENWYFSDIVVHASNQYRPNATIGGIATDGISETLKSNTVVNHAYQAGQIHMGASWNRFGAAGGTQVDDWAVALAHEMGHYALFLQDNYFGVENGQFQGLDCVGSAMSNPYISSYSEFLAPAGWNGACQNTTAERVLGLSDWEIILRHYPMLADYGGESFSGPSVLPLQLLEVGYVEPNSEAALADQLVELLAQDGGAFEVGPQTRGYLYKTQGTEGITDDRVVDLGKPTASGLRVRGLTPGDRLCVFDTSNRAVQTGCAEFALDSTQLITIEVVENWKPEIEVTPISTTTLEIELSLDVTSALSLEGPLMVQLLPAAQIADFITYTAPVETLVFSQTIGNRSIYTQQVSTEFPTFNGHIRVWVTGATPVKESVTDFLLSGDWPVPGFSGSGAAVPGFSGSGAAVPGFSGSGAAVPTLSGDGRVLIINLDPDSFFSDTLRASVQGVTVLPDLPPWLTPIGPGYRLTLGEGETLLEGHAINFVLQYLQTDVVEGLESHLHLYYQPKDSVEWQQLPTYLDTDDNLISTPIPENAVDGQGIFVLVTAVFAPPLEPGWNRFVYPLPEAQPVATALASVAESYTSVYGYNLDDFSWDLYDQTVLQEHPEFGPSINRLAQFEAGRTYFIQATKPITPIIPTLTSLNREGQFLPATYYGWVSPSETFIPEIGDEVVAMINGQVCSETGKLFTLDEKLAYVIQVQANAGDGCGENGQMITFVVAGQIGLQEVVWDNRQAHYLPIDLDKITTLDFKIYLPVIVQNGFPNRSGFQPPIIDKTTFQAIHHVPNIEPLAVFKNNFLQLVIKKISIKIF